MKKLLFLVPMLMACSGLNISDNTTNGYTPLQFFQKYGEQLVYVQNDLFDVQYLGKVNKDNFTYHLYHTLEVDKIMENEYFVQQYSYSLKFREDKTRYVWEDLISYQGCDGGTIYVD